MMVPLGARDRLHPSSNANRLYPRATSPLDTIESMDAIMPAAEGLISTSYHVL